MKEEIIDPVLIKVKDVIKNGKKAIGQQEFIDLLYGDSLNTVKLIRAFCYDCRAWYADGIGDCKDVRCPLYSKMPYKSILIPTRVRGRGESPIRNSQYPMLTRLSTKQSSAGKRSDIKKMVLGQVLEKKMRVKKYPQEITQKEITKEERSIAMFDTAIVKYENEKKKEKKCKEPKSSESTMKV